MLGAYVVPLDQTPLTFHLLGSDASHAALNKKHRHAAHARTASAHGDREEVCPHSVGYPCPVGVQSRKHEIMSEMN